VHAVPRVLAVTQPLLDERVRCGVVGRLVLRHARMEARRDDDVTASPRKTRVESVEYSADLGIFRAGITDRQ
jgi:hypothetical protein